MTRTGIIAVIIVGLLPLIALWGWWYSRGDLTPAPPVVTPSEPVVDTVHPVPPPVPESIETPTPAPLPEPVTVTPAEVSHDPPPASQTAPPQWQRNAKGEWWWWDGEKYIGPYHMQTQKRKRMFGR